MWWSVALDVLVVVLFVVIGRETHEEANALTAGVETAAPFLVGLAFGWGFARAARMRGVVGRGLTVFVSTVLVGMLVRRYVFDDGTAAAFVLVAALFLGAGMLGHRLVRRRFARLPR